MCWTHVDRRVGVSLYPAAEHTTARKYKRVHSVTINDRQFHVTVKRRSTYGLPFHLVMIAQHWRASFDLGQSLYTHDWNADVGPFERAGVFGNTAVSRVAPCRVRGDGCGCRTILHPELGVDLLEMLIHCTRAQTQDLCNVAIGLAFG
jgi:hypothetical protein